MTRSPDEQLQLVQQELAAVVAGCTDDTYATDGQREWLAEQFENLPTRMEVLTPSQWAERYRYLPPSVTPMPGYYRFDVAPYIREIVDCLAVDSPIREISVMKGVQLAFTSGVIENGLGYFIAHVKTAPMMFVTADAELAKLRLETHIIPMLQHSGLGHLIKSGDAGNNRKTGKTASKLEVAGGGYLVMLGAKNANKLRSSPILFLNNDEIDAWADSVGKDGDPLKLTKDRTAAYSESRKVVNGSTPTIKGWSKIEDCYLLGDQRKYFVCCLACGHSQTLKFERKHQKTGQRTGIVWSYTEDGKLDIESVRYLCEECCHPHTNDDKTRLLAPENGAEWRPTAVPVSPDHRSYHISALYSPVGMKSWAECVQEWLGAWDVEHNRPKDPNKLQVFYNNVLGETFELHGSRVTFEQVSPHRRLEYVYGGIPNRFAIAHCGGPILVLVCSVDVHEDNLKVGVWGWAPEWRAFLVEYLTFEGDTEHIDNPKTWGALSELLEQREYKADDGKVYRISVALIDSGFRTDTVYSFCKQYPEAPVYPIKGREAPSGGAPARGFQQFDTKVATVGFVITVDLYKERWAAALRKQWSGLGEQPYTFFNAPLDAKDKELKELTAETKVEKIDKESKRRVGWTWRRPSGSRNELWDLLIYASAAFDLLAHDICVNQLGLEAVVEEQLWLVMQDPNGIRFFRE